VISGARSVKRSSGGREDRAGRGVRRERRGGGVVVVMLVVDMATRAGGTEVCVGVGDLVMGKCHSGRFGGGSSVNTTHDDSIRKNTIFRGHTIGPERHILRTFIHILFPVQQRDPPNHKISSRTTI
jgi:hypothetical protein